MSNSIFISAGEASGEHYGALLVAALQKRLADAGETASFTGMGGPRMADAGLQCVVRSEDMAVMGLTEVVFHLPSIWREFRKLKQAIRRNPPSVAVLIDFPEIHFRLAEEFHRLGVPVIFFVSPQLWAWKKKRIRLVQKYVDKMLVIFPFEEAFYRERGVQAEFVGHPLAELPLPATSREEFAEANGLDPAKTWIGLLPGSRPKEIRDHLPTLLEAARQLVLKGHDFSCAVDEPNQRGALALEQSMVKVESSLKLPSGAKAHPSNSASCGTTEVVPFQNTTFTAICENKTDATQSSLQFLIPLAPTLNSAQQQEVQQLVNSHASGLSVHLVCDARAALHHARASIVASGTATVEAALIGNPFVVVYRVSALTYAIAKRMVKVPHVAMVNLIAGKRIVPELIQDDFTAEKIVCEIETLLSDGPPRQRMIDELAQIRSQLHPMQSQSGSIDRVAEITLSIRAFSGIV
jgi:lipid-A-disaccharide synthase